jgi:hypothetical protein
MAIDDWLAREQPSDVLRDAVLGRLLDLVMDPLPPWSGKIAVGRYLADLSEDPLVVGLYGLGSRAAAHLPEDDRHARGWLRL